MCSLYAAYKNDLNAKLMRIFFSKRDRIQDGIYREITLMVTLISEESCPLQ